MSAGFSLLRGALCGQWVPSCSSLGSMQMLHSMAASCSLVVSQQWRAASSTASSAAATSAASSASSTPQPKQQKQKQQKQAPAPAAAAAQQQQQQQQQEVQLQHLRQQYQRSRLLDYHMHHLSREMMLKLNVRTVQQLPRVKSIDLAISAKDLYGKRYVEKWEMLLPALALEYITGQPATFVTSTVKYYRSRNAATAVKVHVSGGAALDLLQKLTYVVLPSQNGFRGVSSKSFDKAGNLHFRVQRMVNFPDFEEQFEIFENLGALHVSINMANVSRAPHRAHLLLTGLQLPILPAKGAAGEEGEGAESSDEGEEEGSESDEN